MSESTTPTPAPSSRPGHAMAAGMPMIVIGIALGILPRTLDLHGFLGGMLQGMAIALLVGGAYVMGSRWRKGGDGDDPTWLPSRDGRG